MKIPFARFDKLNGYFNLKKSCMKIKWIIIGVVSVLVVFFFIKMMNKIEKQEGRINDIENAYSEIITSTYKSWRLTMSNLNDVKLINKMGNTSNLFDVLIDKKIVFYFDSKMCDVCVAKELENLRNMGKLIGYEDIIIIGHSINPQIFQNEEFQPFFNNMWRCSKKIYENDIIGDVPIISLVDNEDIIMGYYAPKITNDMIKIFIKIAQEKFTN